jgi:RNA polymerase sigma factor (sigma-70 family)
MSSDVLELGPHARDSLLDALVARREAFVRFVRVRATAAHAARRDPDEIVQAAFLAAVGRRAEFDRSGMTAEAWFYRLLNDAVVSDHRHHRRERRDDRAETGWPSHSSVQGALGLHADDTSPSEGAARREAAARVAGVLATLSADHQQILALVDLAGLSCAAAAAVAGIDAAAARKRHSRARVRFEEVWGERYGVEEPADDRPD